MEDLDSDMDIEQIELKIARMKRAIARKQQKLRKWEEAAESMKNVSSKTNDEAKPSTEADESEPDEGGSDVTSGKENSGSSTIPFGDPADRLTQVDISEIEHSDVNSTDCEPKNPSPADARPKFAAEDASSAPRRSSRQPRSSYILNSDDFITFDFWNIRYRRKPIIRASQESESVQVSQELESSRGSQESESIRVSQESESIRVSQESESIRVSQESESCPAGFTGEPAMVRPVFPAPPKTVVQHPIIDFCLPEDEFAAWKIRFRRKTSLRSSARAACDQKKDKKKQTSPVTEDIMVNEKITESPLLSRFESAFSLDTRTHESVNLVHCGRITYHGQSACAIATVQDSKISVWHKTDRAWTLLLMVPLVLQSDGFYQFNGFNLPNSMGLALVAVTGGERGIWCYDLSPPGREHCLESVPVKKSERTSCGILSCVVGDTLICAQLGSKGTQLKTYCLNALKGKQLCRLSGIKDELNALHPVTQLKDAVIGFSATHLYIWNHQSGELRKQMRVPGNSPFHKCTFAQEESGLLMLGIVTGDDNPRHHLMALNPTTQKWRVLREYQDVVELPNQCLRGATQMGQHLVAGGGVAVGRVAIWNIFSGNLAAFLNDRDVTAVCGFPGEHSKEFMVATGTRKGRIVLYRLPFPQV